MPTIQTVSKPDQVLVQINGSVRMIADEVNVTVAAALAQGTILASASAVLGATPTAVFGVLLEDKPAGSKVVRVMTRGNPSSVNAQDLNYGAATDTDAVDALLEAKGIVVVNK